MNLILSVRFFATEGGSEPVRECLKGLSAQDRKTIGEDIKTVQFGCPLGMPLVAHLESDIWEVRIKLDNRIARVLFVMDKHTMILLHGLINKSQKHQSQKSIWQNRDYKHYEVSNEQSTRRESSYW